MERFSALFPESEVAFVAGDWEFVGQAWTFYRLLNPVMSFQLRIRGTDRIGYNGQARSARLLFAHLQPGEKQRLSGACHVWGCAVTVEALRLPDGKLLTVIAPVGTRTPVQDYA